MNRCILHQWERECLRVCYFLFETFYCYIIFSTRSRLFTFTCFQTLLNQNNIVLNLVSPITVYIQANVYSHFDISVSVLVSSNSVWLSHCSTGTLYHPVLLLVLGVGVLLPTFFLLLFLFYYFLQFSATHYLDYLLYFCQLFSVFTRCIQHRPRSHFGSMLSLYWVVNFLIKHF